MAAENGFEPFITQIIEKDKTLIAATDNFGRTPLHYTANCMRVDLLEALAKNGADGLAQDKNGDTVLHLAVSQQQNWMHGMYLGKFLDTYHKHFAIEGFKLRNKKNETLAMLAMERLDFDTVIFLKKIGIDISEIFNPELKFHFDVRHTNGDNLCHLFAAMGANSDMQAVLNTNWKLFFEKNDNGLYPAQCLDQKSLAQVLSQTEQTWGEILKANKDVLVEKLKEMRNDLVKQPSINFTTQFHRQTSTAAEILKMIDRFGSQNSIPLVTIDKRLE